MIICGLGLDTSEITPFIFSSFLYGISCTYDDILAYNQSRQHTGFSGISLPFFYMIYTAH